MHIIVIAALIIIFAVAYFFETRDVKEHNAEMTASGENVILVHGILRGSSSMNKIRRGLSHQGFIVTDFGYSAKDGSIDEISARLHKEACKIGKGKIHFVTHSLGGIIVRYYISKYKPNNIGRVVMIAPPNSCSVFAAKLSNLPLYESILGRPGREIAHGEDCIVKDLPEPDFEFGIIAGGTGFKMGFNPFLKGDNDGTVLLNETKMSGMSDFMQIRGQHSLLLFSKEVVFGSINFIKNGKFQKKIVTLKKIRPRD